METIISAMNTLIDNLAVIDAVIASQEEEAGDELAGLYEQMSTSFNLAVAIRDAMKRVAATPAETAELIAGTAREVFGKPVEEEGSEDGEKRSEKGGSARGIAGE